MLVLSKEVIQNIFTMRDAIEASKEAMRLYSEKKAEVPLRVTIQVPKYEGKSLFMPAYVEPLDAIGIKVASVFSNNRAIGKPSIIAQMLLIDGKTGEVIAIIDGTYLTQLRTGALQGAATDLLARKDAKIGVLIGAGGQAPAQLEAMLTARPLSEVRVVNSTLERAQAFVEQVQAHFKSFKTNIVAVKDANAAIRDADVITTATTARHPVFDANFLKPGVHINGIGGYMPEIQEIPTEAVQKADKILMDTREGVLEEAGDLLIPIQEGKLSLSDLDGELGEVILNKIKGRETDEEITFFKAVGSAVFDVVTAQMIYEKAVAAKVGQHIAL